jgi:hypothetical protein
VTRHHRAVQPDTEPGTAVCWRSRCAAALVGVAAVMTAVATSVPASASPLQSRGIMLAPVCALVPMMPDLDHDIDLTQQFGTGDPMPMEGPAPTGTEPAMP